MSRRRLKTVLDANVLYPFTLRDTFPRAAAAGLFEVYWSERILDEAADNLVADSMMTREQAQRLRAAMARAFPEALVAGFERLIPSMKNDPKDRHVAAAAVLAGAQVIVTSNLRDFAPLPDRIEARTPDAFLGHVFEHDPDGMLEIVRAQAADLRKPPRSFEEVLAALAKMVPGFAARVRAHAARQR